MVINKRKPKTLTDDYTRFSFVNKEAALAAKSRMERKYPSVKMKVSEAGTLFCHRNGSTLFDQVFLDDVIALGGVNA